MQTTKTTTIHKTIAPVEGKLIEKHIKIQEIKLWFSIITSGICFLLLIISGVSTHFIIDQKVLGWIAVGAAMVLASSQIKTIKDILKLI